MPPSDNPSFDNDAVLPPAGKGIVCGTSLPCTTAFGNMRTYVPTTATPLKVVEVNFNVMQKSDGTGNWKDTLKDRQAFDQLIAWANDYFVMSGCNPTDPCPGVSYPSETKIRLSLENVYFYQSDALWSSTNTDALLQAVDHDHPGALRQLNVFFSAGSYGGGSAFSVTPYDDRSVDQAVVMLHATDSPGDGSNLRYAAVGTLVHELGHVFGLYHTYQDGCCPETNDASSCEYLDDVFCPPNHLFPHQAGWGCDPNGANNSCTNNMMGGVQDACLFSPLQLGRMHRSLSITSAQKYVKPTACAAAPGGMVLWLPFNEASGTTALNTLGKSGTLMGGPARVPGKVQGALDFDGRSQYVQVPDQPALNLGRRDFSVEVWLRRGTNDDSVRVIADKRSTNGVAYYGYSFFLFDGRPALQLADGGYDNYIAPNAIPADSDWHHVAVTVRRSSGGTIWVDGNAVYRFDTTAHRLSLDNNSPLYIGNTTLPLQSSFFKGGLDEVVLYARALTGAEVAAMFNAGSAGRCTRSCSAPSVSFPQNAPMVAVDGQICNATANAQSFIYWYEGMPGGTCPITPGVVPPSFSPCSGVITVPAGTCMTLPTQASRPLGFNNDEKSLCYRLTVQSLGSQDVANTRCEGILMDYSPGPPH